MKRCLFSFAVCLFTLSITAQRPNALIDVQHYTYALTLSDDNDQLKGKATIDILFLKDAKTFSLDLISKKNDGKGMTVTAAAEKNQPLSFRHTSDEVAIDLSTAAKAGDTRTIEISYEGIPADGLIISNNKYKHRGFFGDNWPNRARNWLPCVDHPADKAAVDFIVTAPDHYQVVANGVQVEETTLPGKMKLTHYKETVPLPTKIMVIGASDFAVQYAGEVQCIPIHSWIYPEDKEKGFYDYAQATEILPWFIKNVGPYAYKKLANVQSKTIFGGMENAGTIFYSENSVTGTRKSESLLAHEIAHQWFGDMATEADWSHLWLSEGFATYMTILYFEQKYGMDTAQKMRATDRLQVIAFNKQTQRPVVDSSESDYMQLLNANSYQKGGWVLHMLRRELGDTLFWKGIRTYYSRYSGKNALTDDLRKVMEAISGKDLTIFFRQWLFTPGQPQLAISWKYDATKKMITGTIQQQQKDLFQFPLELAVFFEGNEILTQKVVVKERRASFSISAPRKPQSLVPDPGVNLLFEANTIEQ